MQKLSYEFLKSLSLANNKQNVFEINEFCYNLRNPRIVSS